MTDDFHRHADVPAGALARMEPRLDYGRAFSYSGFNRVFAEYLPWLDLIMLHFPVANPKKLSIDKLAENLTWVQRFLFDHEKGHLLLNKRSGAWHRMYSFNLLQNLLFLDIIEGRNDPHTRFVRVSDRETSVKQRLAWLMAGEYQLEYLCYSWEPLQESYADVVSSKLGNEETTTLLKVNICRLQDEGPTVDIDSKFETDSLRNFERYSPFDVERDRKAWRAFCRSYQVRVLETVLGMYEEFGSEKAFKDVQDLATTASNLQRPRPPSTVFWHMYVKTYKYYTGESATDRQKAVNRRLSRIIPDVLMKKYLFRRFGIKTLRPDPDDVRRAVLDEHQKLMKYFKSRSPEDFLTQYITALDEVVKQGIDTPEPAFVVTNGTEVGKDHLFVSTTIEQVHSEEVLSLLKFHFGLTTLREAFTTALRTEDYSLSQYTFVPELQGGEAAKLLRYYGLAMKYIAEHEGQREVILTMAKDIFEEYRGDEGFRFPASNLQG